MHTRGDSPQQLQCLGSSHPYADLDGIPGCWLHPGQALPVGGIRGVNQRMEDLPSPSSPAFLMKYIYYLFFSKKEVSFFRHVREDMT